jgi:hypothetical protein
MPVEGAPPLPRELLLLLVVVEEVAVAAAPAPAALTLVLTLRARLLPLLPGLLLPPELELRPLDMDDEERGEGEGDATRDPAGDEGEERGVMT